MIIQPSGETKVEYRDATVIHNVERIGISRCAIVTRIYIHAHVKDGPTKYTFTGLIHDPSDENDRAFALKHLNENIDRIFARHDIDFTRKPMKAEKPQYQVVSIITDKDRAELEKRFTYHAPKPTQPERYAALRSKAKELAELIMETVPDSRERSTAITKIEEATFWANAGIARNE